MLNTDLDICQMLDVIESFDNISIYSKTIPDHYNVFHTFFNPEKSNIRIIITPGYGIEILQKNINVHYLDTITKLKDINDSICISCSNGFFMKVNVQPNKLLRFDTWNIYLNASINKCPVYELMSKCSNISIIKNVWSNRLSLEDRSYTSLGIKWLNESNTSE